MRLMIAGGGTGGHVYPGIALVEEFRSRIADLDVLWVGTRDRMEAQAVPRAGIDIEFLDVAFLKGRRGLALLKALFCLPASGFAAFRLVRKFKPDAIVGLGGFVSGPVVAAAALLGVPVFLLEQNAVPGIANRLNARFARTVFATFAESREHFPEGKTQVPGNPMRGEILSTRTRLVPTYGPLNIFVFGGSQGAAVLNEKLPGIIREAAENAGVQLYVLHGSGRDREAGVAERYASDRIQVDVRGYIDDMADAYQAADLVICRAGATTISELTVVGLPAVYVPFPHAADDHQTMNAKSVESNGGGIVLAEAELGTPAATEALTELLSNRERIARMAKAAAALGRPDAGRDIVDAILTSVNQRLLTSDRSEVARERN